MAAAQGGDGGWEGCGPAGEVAGPSWALVWEGCMGWGHGTASVVGRGVPAPQCPPSAPSSPQPRHHPEHLRPASVKAQRARPSTALPRQQLGSSIPQRLLRSAKQLQRVRIPLPHRLGVCFMLRGAGSSRVWAGIPGCDNRSRAEPLHESRSHSHSPGALPSSGVCAQRPDLLWGPHVGNGVPKQEPGAAPTQHGPAAEATESSARRDLYRSL